MPNASRAKEKVWLEISMAGLARVHDRYLKGMEHAIVLGDELARDYRWISEIERILLGKGYLTAEEIRKRHLMTNARWLPEYDQNYSPGNPNDPSES